MGGKSSKVVPSNTVIHVAAQKPPDSLENSQTTGSLVHQESSASSSLSRPASFRSKRPISQLSKYSGKVGLSTSSRPKSFNKSGAVDFGNTREVFQPTRVEPFTPLDLASSFKSSFNTGPHRQHPLSNVGQLCERTSIKTDDNSYLLRVTEKGTSSIQCPSCSAPFSGVVHIPYLLLCGHSFCDVCIDNALKEDPTFLKCGQCGIDTPIETQGSPDDLVKNESILDLLNSKEFACIKSDHNLDRCAECEKTHAVVYCSECSASYCESCNKQQHTGSKVRSKHKPVSINLKPRPQPTCRKHPGQSCVLYCETECQPMCVLCKFYGQHKFHTYQLLNNSATTYRNTLQAKLAQIEEAEKSIQQAAVKQSELMSEIKRRAIESQEKLEKYFIDTRNEAIAALEHREATLLCLLDKQVEIQERILQEQRMNLAAARSRTVTAKEELTRLLDINPISALLARKHVDSSIDDVLKQTDTFSDQSDDKNHSQIIPVGLRPQQELSSKLHQILNQHGIILQLPDQPVFKEVTIHLNKSIHLHWEIPNQTHLEVTSDGTRVFSLYCFADVPFKFKKDKFQNLNRQLLHIKSANSPADSGYQDTASDETTSQASDMKINQFPSIPASLRTCSSQNVSLVTMLPSERIEVKSTLTNQAAQALNLPLLKTKQLEDEDNTSLCSESDHDMYPISEGKYANPKSVPPIEERTQSAESTSSSSSSTASSEAATPQSPLEGINIGSFCKGYAFEKIYSGQKNKFSYTGIVPGATYYFRVQCHNNVGTGPWSDTYKCKINSGLIR